MTKKHVLLLSISCFLIINMAGCEAIVKKFTRKSSHEGVKEEMVLAPQEYTAPVVSKEEQYRQYFLYWKSWTDELMEALSSGSNQKKMLDCADEAIKNLKELKNMVKADKQSQIGSYLERLQSIRRSIADDIYGSRSLRNRDDVDRIRRDMMKDFSYQKIKNDLA